MPATGKPERPPDDRRAGTLYVVATPIGHLDDVTRRALEVLASVELAACEDTRRTRKLLSHFGVRTRLISCHEHNEKRRVPEILRHLAAGRSVALVTDAGTPCISDPGHRLVRAARAAGVPIESIPGPSALTAALSISGIPADRFVFLGFLDAKGSGRRRALEGLAAEARPIVLMEAPHRIVRTLRDLEKTVGGERRCFLGRELTKLHEEHMEGTLAAIRRTLEAREEILGEIVLVLESAGRKPAVRDADPGKLRGEVRALVESEGLPRKEAIKEVARRRGLPKSRVYNAVVEEKE
jgi:16S rRNA (cytidine1402-2'-O)-methyltransferase